MRIGLTQLMNKWQEEKERRKLVPVIGKLRNVAIKYKVWILFRSCSEKLIMERTLRQLRKLKHG